MILSTYRAGHALCSRQPSPRVAACSLETDVVSRQIEETAAVLLSGRRRQPMKASVHRSDVAFLSGNG